jgi:hypothetical protein
VNLIDKLHSKHFQLRVHIWGGLGSQIFGYLAALRISERYPLRPILLIFHNSGVTKRLLQLFDYYPSAFKFFQIDDYLPASPLHQKKNSNVSLILRNVRVSIGKFLIKAKFVSRLESFEDFSRIKPWTLAVRGHYSQLPLEESDLQMVLSILDISQRIEISESATLHFRLGDLISLESKSYTQPQSLLEVINIELRSATLLVFSDSSDFETRQILNLENHDMVVKFLNSDIFYTIKTCVFSREFIGTNSKISIWIALLRVYLFDNKLTFLPESLKSVVLQICPPHLLKFIRFYK